MRRRTLAGRRGNEEGPGGTGRGMAGVGGKGGSIYGACVGDQREEKRT